MCWGESPDPDPRRLREESECPCGFLSGAPFTSDGLPRCLDLTEAGFVADGKKGRPLTSFV